MTALDPLDRFRAAVADRYRVDRELGHGGMAVVYLATDLKHHRAVAIKALRPELAAALGTGRFGHEIGITAQLVHPHILPLLDSGEALGIPYYVTPFVEGQSLRDRLNQAGRLSLDEALAIAEQVAGALDYAHRQGVVHRDIKPENILLPAGQALVADFGIAIAVASAGGSRLTGTGIAIGTPAYMSPEQLTGEAGLDHRADLYALGAVLYEMLAGSPPFSAPTASATIARRLTEPVPPLRKVRADVPAALDRAIERVMAPAPDQRFESGAAFLAAARAGRPRFDRRLLGLFGAAGVLLAVAIIVPLWMRLDRQRALLSLAEIERRADQGRFAEAFDLAMTARRRLPGDTTLARLLPAVSDRLTIESDPAGATVTLQRFDPDPAGRFPPPVSAGVTPQVDLRVPRGDYRVVVTKAGFAPAERMASSEAPRSEHAFRPDSVIRVTVRLLPATEAADQVFVPGGEYQLVSPDAPLRSKALLRDFYLDRREVTNAAFHRFIREGGYAKGSLWPPAADPARRATLVDRTKLPGPRAWNGQEFPTGRGDHPVTDVTWFEASAYCAAAGQRLPTVYEWEKAARNGITLHQLQWVVPWGVATPHSSATFRANLAGTGTVPVGSYPFGISPFGAYDMAGNVSEWTRSRSDQGYLATGGSYRDPIYLFAQYGFFPPDFASPTLGFRCGRSADRSGLEPEDPRLDVTRRTPVYPVTTAARFAELRHYYDYDPRPLNAHIVARVETPDWIDERVRFAGVAGDSVLADLFLPRGAAPPYQTIVYVASNGAFAAQPARDEATWLLGPHLKAGRAVFVVTMKGMIGREWEPGHRRPAPSSVQFRDEMVLHATELRLGLDYLDSRADLDHTRLAYFGLSWGAGSRVIFAALDDRFRAVVLIGGGIDERMQPTLPEANNVNFVPHLRTPILLVNGRNDEEHTWLGRGLPLWNLLPEPKKLVLVDGAGHIPPDEARIPAINGWLDSVFGPVKR